MRVISKRRLRQFREKPAGKRRAQDTYLELVRQFPLKSIRDENELTKAECVVKRLLERRQLDSGEEDYLDALSDLIAVYEDNHCEFPQVSGADLLAHLIEAKGVKQADVAKKTGISRSTISELLSGKRTIAINHIPMLADYFAVPQSVFLTGDSARNK